MDIQLILNLTSELSLTLLLLAPTIFVFSVTLLGSAIEHSSEEEKTARENEKTSIQKEIDEVKNLIDQAQQNLDTSNLIGRLESLKKRKVETESKVNKIKIKYRRIDFTNTVAYPSAAILFCLALGPIGTWLSADSFIAVTLLVLLQLILIFYTVTKFTMSLMLVQEISATKKEAEAYTKLTKAFTSALEQHAQSSQGEAALYFVDKKFPLNVSKDSDLDIAFKLRLTKGTFLDDAKVWFFIPDGFELISPSESWRQRSDYNLPNIRTVQFAIGKLSVGSYSVIKHLKLKTPSVEGKYLLRYKVYADGYGSSDNDFNILVG